MWPDPPSLPPTPPTHWCLDTYAPPAVVLLQYGYSAAHLAAYMDMPRLLALIIESEGSRRKQPGEQQRSNHSEALP